MRKYEIYLPLKYNDGESIESAKIVAIWDDLADAFGGVTVSSLSAPYQGRWKYGGVEYIDDIIKIEVVTTNDRKAIRFFKDFKVEVSATSRYPNHNPWHSGHLS